MTAPYTFLKNLALKILPQSVLQPLRVWHHRRTLRSFSDAEEPDIKVIRKLVPRGSLVVDLGANIGMYTKVLSDLVGPGGTVISVEPVPSTFDVLSRNVRSLGMHNVRAANVAVSDSAGEVLMNLPNYESGGTNFYQASVVAATERQAGAANQVRVPAMTLDSVVSGAGVVSFVKCDVEGHELACLAGAKKVLAADGAAWLIEVWGDPDERTSVAMQTFNTFEKLSYAAWWFDGTRLQKRRSGERSTNYFFLKDAHVSALKKNAPEFFAETN
jgi:FkbM family methyltransferase